MRRDKLTFWTTNVLHCGHCHAAYPTDNIYPETFIESDNVYILKVAFECAACGEDNFFLQYDDKSQNKNFRLPFGFIPIWPFLNDRPICPPEVPSHIADDYAEACLVLKISPKASAALSRRCLQNILREAAKVKPSDLSKEIQEVVDNEKIPSQLIDSIDAIRNIGNFAAHPVKSKSTGEVVDVEPEEAGWNLDVLEALFDFYYVQPAKVAKKREALNAKLSEAGKPPMK
jgi:hypothetical protein